MVITPPPIQSKSNSKDYDDGSFSESLIGKTMNKNIDLNEKGHVGEVTSPASTSSSITQPTTLLSAFLKKTQTSTSQEYLRHSGSKRRASSEPTASEDPWGWFEDFENPVAHGNTDKNGQSHFLQQPLQRSLSLPGPITQPPFYILESSLETQQLWYVTAGQRPKQPEKERKHFEQLWAENFNQSSVLYSPPSQSTVDISNTHKSAISPSKGTKISGPDLVKIVTSVDLSATARGTVDRIPLSEFDGEILFRGKGSFSNAVSKTFTDNAMTTITIQVQQPSKLLTLIYLHIHELTYTFVII